MTDRAYRPTIGFLGPPGTFSEEALRSEPRLAGCDAVPLPTFPDVVAAVEDGRTTMGCLAIENSIEGTVNSNLDALVLQVSRSRSFPTPPRPAAAGPGGLESAGRPHHQTGFWRTEAGRLTDDKSVPTSCHERRWHLHYA